MRVNQLLDDDGRIPNDEKVNALTLLVREMMDEQTNMEKRLRRQEETINNLQNELSTKKHIV